MTQDELAVMSNAKCILQLRGERPFLSDKYDITKHPNYEFLSDFDPKLVFDIEKELSIKLKLGKSQITDVYDIGSVEEELENSRT
jgi:type IV secretion system protein VirD4